jgi:hypothetical protein
MNKMFFRWSALLVIVGSIFLGAGYLLCADIDKNYIDEFASTQGLISSVMVGIGSLLFLSGLPGLFAAQNLYSSKTGILASTLGFIGMAAFHLGTLALYFVAPVLVMHNAATRALMYSDEPPFPRFALFWAAALLIQVIGLLWIGLKTSRIATCPKLNSLLVIAGALVFLSAPFIYFPLIKPGNTIVMLGFAFMAIVVWRSNEKQTASSY